jgi:hypothetical protein
MSENLSPHPNISPNPSEVMSTFENTQFFWIGILYFCFVGTHAKFQNPTIKPSGRKGTEAEEREKKMPLIVDT